MYKPFSDTQNIQKALRQIVVFDREQELANSIIIKEYPFFKFGEPYYRWGKYISNIASKKRNPQEAYVYWDEKIENDFVEILSDKIQSEKNYLEKLERYFLKTHKNFRKLTDSFFKKGHNFFKNKSNAKLADLFKRFNLESGRAISGSYIPYYSVVSLERIIESEIGKILIFLRKENGWQGIFETLTAVGGETFIQAEWKEFFKKLKAMQRLYRKGKNWKDKSIQELIFKQWYDFGVLIFNYKAKRNYTLADYQDKFYKGLNVNTDKEIEKIKKEGEQKKKQINRVISKFKKYPQILRHIKWFRKMITYRNRDAEYYFVFFYHCQVLFDEISRRLKIAGDDIFLLGKEEIVGGLKGKVDVGRIVNERREKGFTIKGVGGSVKVLTGVKKEDWYENEYGETPDFFRGSTASSGKAIGKVKIIIDARREGGKFKKGEILVTATTKPEFVPLMKLSVAIITDEGGIVSHAAILARELKKPCVIGTKIATKVLKDGDLVELDADKGVVTILKKK